MKGGNALERYITSGRAVALYKIKSAADLDRFGQLPFLFAYHSGRIENAEIPIMIQEDFRKRQSEQLYRQPPHPVRAANQKQCYEFLKEKIIGREPLSVDLSRRFT
jgi:hypothetical protein